MPVDWLSTFGLLAGLALLSAGAVIVLGVSGGPGFVMIALALIGFAYGGIIAAYPAAITKMFGVLAGPRIYGHVFTAWGFAGLFAPFLAGGLFDWTGSYQLALLTAGALGVISFAAITLFSIRGGAIGSGTAK